jgi:hypothetical protein
MPELGRRRRLGERPAERRRRLIRWFYSNRPRFAAITAFAVACLIGLAAASLGAQAGAAAPAR